MDADGNVYKMIGPVLVKQDLEEAKQTVAKRMEYISGEMWVKNSAKLKYHNQPCFSIQIKHPNYKTMNIINTTIGK